MTPEEYFFRYAYPCTEDLLRRKWIDEATFDDFTRIAHGLAQGKKVPVPDRQELEEVYENAFRRIRKLAARQKKNYWSISTIREYFHREHNACIDRGDDHYANEPEFFKELCKVHEAEVVGLEQTVNMEYDGQKRPVDVYKVRYDGKEKLVFNFYNLGNVEGKVRIHYAFIIEKS